MIYIKHEQHGFLPVDSLTNTQKAAGWVVCDIYEEIAGKSKKGIMDMSKQELERYAREDYDVELDLRKSKANMLKDFEEAINDRK